MKFRPTPNFTAPMKPHADAPPAMIQAYEDYQESLKITCTDSIKQGQLQLKLDEYILRLQTTVNPQVARDAICKIAVIDKIILSEDNSASYFDSFDYAIEGIELYGADILISSSDESDAFLGEFDRSFKTIRAYVESGNENVVGGKLFEL